MENQIVKNTIRPGFIKLNRLIMTWEWYSDINTCRVFIHLLLCAQWEDSNIKGIFVPRGSVLTSIRKIATETALTFQQARTALSHLKQTGDITINTYSKYSIISIKSWDKYQLTNTQNNTQTPENQHTEHTQSNNIKEYKKIRNKEYSSHAHARGGEKEQSFDIEEYERKSRAAPVYKRRESDGGCFKF